MHLVKHEAKSKNKLLYERFIVKEISDKKCKLLVGVRFHTSAGQGCNKGLWPRERSKYLGIIDAVAAYLL